MKKILFVMFAWAICANMGYALNEFSDFGRLQWHKCENIIDNNKQGESTPKWRKTTLQWRKCGGESNSSRHTELSQESEVSKSHESNKNYELMSQKQNNELNNDLALQDCDSRDLESSGLDSSLVSLAQNDGEGESHNGKSGESVESRNNDSGKSPESALNRNAFFAGIELGYMRFDYAESGKIGTNALLNPSSNDAFNAGIIAGYRYFFNDSVGIRGYANLNYNYDKANGFGELKMLNVGINADFLLNFYASQSVDFGAIVGLGFGGDIFDGDGLKRVRETIDEHSANLSSPNVSINLGFQIVAINKIGVEFVAKIPLLAHYFLNAGDGKLDSQTRKLSQNYSLNGRIIYHF
ncbi:outer membrane beta-barrel protein [Helicobacter sp. 23-1045]